MGPYLTHVYGYDLEERGSFLLIPVLAQIIGSLLWGPMDRLAGSHKLPVLVGAGATAAALAYLAIAGTVTPPAALVAWFAAFGFLCAFGVVLIGHGKALFPLHVVGRALTVLNIGSMGGVFLMQIVSGFVIGLFPTAPDGPTRWTPTASSSACRLRLSCWARWFIWVPAIPFRAPRRAALRRSHRKIGHHR